MTDETTPDAVEQAIASLVNVLVNECSHTSETASALDVCLANLRHARHAERARHAEEVASMLDEIEDWEAAAQELSNRLVVQTADSDSLRDQLRRTEGEREEVLRMIDGLRKSEKTAREYINMRLRDEAQAENVQLKAERDALRSLLPDVRACAEYCRNILIGPPGMPVEDYPLAPVALAARNILAALDSQGGEGE